MDRSNTPDGYLLERSWSALLFDTLEHYDFVIAKLTAFLEQNSAHVPARNNRAIAYWEIGRLDEAINDLTVAAQHNKNDPLPFKHWGMVLQQQGKLEEAIQKLRQGLEVAPEDAPLLATLAHALRDADRLEESLEYLSRAIAANRLFN